MSDRRSCCVGRAVTRLLTAAALAASAFNASGQTESSARGATPEHVVSDEELLSDYYTHVLVVTVDSIADVGPFTNKRPPHPILRVVRVLKGQVDAQTVASEWAPFPHAVDYVSDESETSIARWGERPLEAPTPGGKWIVAGEFHGSELRVSPRCRFPHAQKLERQVQFVLENAPAWLEKAYKLVGPAGETAREKDAARENQADLERLCAASTDIVVGTAMSFEVGLGSFVVLLYDSQRLLDSRPIQERVERPVVGVDARFDARTMVDLRSRSRTNPSHRVIAFMRTSDHDTPEIPEQARARRDPRMFVFSDNVNGLMQATPERVEKVRAVLARKGETTERRR